MNEKDQHATEDEVVHDRAGGDGDQRGAVIIRNQFHARRKAAVGIDLLDLRPHARHHVVGVQRPIHNDDGGDDIVLVVAAGFAEPRRVADDDGGDILDEYRHAVELAERNVLDVLDLVALGQIGGAAGIDQADAANVHGLLPHIDGAAADIDVGGAERTDHLRQRDVVGVELVQIDLDLVLLGRSAPGVELHDPRNGEQPALQNPILDGAQIAQAEVRRSGYLIAIDLADQAGGLDLRRDVIRQTDILLQIDRGLGKSEVIVDAVIERHPNEREAVERRRTNDIDSGRRGKTNFERDGVVALHLLGRQAGRLRRDFQDHRSRIRIGLDVQLRKREQPGAQEDQEAEQNQRTLRQPECEQASNHGWSLASMSRASPPDRAAVIPRWQARCSRISRLR